MIYNYHGKVNSLVIFNSIIFSGTSDNGIFKSIDGGDTWTESNRGIIDFNITTLTIANNIVYAGSNNGFVYTYNPNSDYWEQIGNAESCINTIVVNGHIVLGTDNGILVSIDSGRNWKSFDQNLSTKRIYVLYIDSPRLFAGTYFGGIFISLDNGISWKEININIKSYLGLIEIPISPVIPNLVERLYLVPLIEGKPVLNFEQMSINETNLINYNGTNVFPDTIFVQFSGHITGEVS
jgi:hypothetical protein